MAEFVIYQTDERMFFLRNELGVTPKIRTHIFAPNVLIGQKNITEVKDHEENDIEKNGYVKITQDGKEGQKSAYRMGDFVLIYPEGYDIQKVKDILNKKV